MIDIVVNFYFYLTNVIEIHKCAIDCIFILILMAEKEIIRTFAAHIAQL